MMDKLKVERDESRRRADSLDAVRDTELKVREQVKKVRNEAAELAAEQGELKRSGNRPERFGDERLHQDDHS